jgi:integrase/recombinase XerD
MKEKESTMKCIVDDDVVLSRPLEGPLSAHIAGFAKWARDEGYASPSRWRKVFLAAGFSRWLGQQAVSVRRISSEHVARYFRSRVGRVQIQRGDAAALRQFIDLLHRQGVVPTPKIPPSRLTPVEQALDAFARYLRNERMLARATIVHYVPFIRAFLTHQFGHRAVRLSRLCARDIVRFVQCQAPRLHLKRAKLLTTALRCFLHYARYRGDITCDMAAAVPTVANWSMTSIPRAIPADAVRRLLASINRRTAIGRRDYAILLLLARLGLRAGEVTGLELEDIDWNLGSLSVQGKGDQRCILPLPADVGGAIAVYLRHGRPRSTSRRIFHKDSLHDQVAVIGEEAGSG